MKNLKKFIDEVMLSGEFEGCKFKTFDESDLFLVFSWTNASGLCGKIAYNVDSLQCDYDFDWEFPTNNDRECIAIEHTCCEDKSPEYLWNYFKRNYAYVRQAFEEQFSIEK